MNQCKTKGTEALKFYTAAALQPHYTAYECNASTENIHNRPALNLPGSTANEQRGISVYAHTIPQLKDTNDRPV